MLRLFSLPHFNRTLALAFVVGCFLSARPEAFAQGRTVVIDAGHGGFDRGGVPRQSIGEKALTLDVAQRLRGILQSSGCRVIMTRNSDVFVPLGQRTAIANSYRGATFISIHFNSASRPGANGIETYYYRGDSASLAANIHRNVVAISPSENRGIRRRGYFVLRRTAIPSVLVECGFLTNPLEGRYALQASYRQKLAEAIARGFQGQRAAYTKPLNRGSSASSEVLPQNLSGPDFVRASPRERSSSRQSKRHGRKSSHSSHKKSSSEKSSSKKKSSKKKSSGSSSKKKKKKKSE